MITLSLPPDGRMMIFIKDLRKSVYLKTDLWCYFLTDFNIYSNYSLLGGFASVARQGTHQ